MLYENLLLRKNLLPNPVVDANSFFERSELKNRVNKITTAILQGKNRVQIVIGGSNGSGKTHLLAFLRKRIFDKSQIRCIDIDFIFARLPFQLYSQLLGSLELNGCLDAFLEFVSKPSGFSDLRSITSASTVLSTVSIRVGRNPSKLRQWLSGNLSKYNDTWMPDIKDIWNEIDVITNILRFYYAVFQEQSYPILIADHCEVLFDDLITYIKEDNRINMMRLLSSVMDMSSFFVSIESDRMDRFNKALYPKSASYDRIDLTALERNDMGEFIADARNEFVDHSKLENLSVIKLDEHLTASSFPLTSEAELYLLSLNPLEPGKLVSILQKSLVKSVEKRNEYFISKSDIEDTIKENFSTILFRCIHCGSRLSMLIVETTSPAGNRPPKIKAVKCPHCNLTTDNLVDYLPNILKTIALDTSSLVSLDFSALNNWLGELKKQRVKVIISKAVLSEMSSWDKKPDKYIISRLARQEYQMLVSLDSTGKILLINDAGRNPTFAEIREATSFNSIDRLIIDIAEIEGATLFTHDQDMASYSCGRAGFTFLFKSE